MLAAGDSVGASVWGLAAPELTSTGERQQAPAIPRNLDRYGAGIEERAIVAASLLSPCAIRAHSAPPFRRASRSRLA